jgi:hypothetical protein
LARVLTSYDIPKKTAILAKFQAELITDLPAYIIPTQFTDFFNVKIQKMKKESVLAINLQQLFSIRTTTSGINAVKQNRKLFKRVHRESIHGNNSRKEASRSNYYQRFSRDWHGWRDCS